MKYIVKEIRQGYFVVRKANGFLADSSSVEQPGPAVEFDQAEAERVAEGSSVDHVLCGVASIPSRRRKKLIVSHVYNGSARIKPGALLFVG